MLLEITHFIIPNRAFELKDVIANSVGVISIYLWSKIKK